MLGLTLSISLSLIAPAPAPATFGPPILCSPFEIEGARSLPWTDSGAVFSKVEGVEPREVVDRTLSILSRERRTVVRLETLRRAAIYLGEGASQSERELARLVSEMRGRLVDAMLDGKPDAAPWLDLGYFLCAESELSRKRGRGYDYLVRAVELDPENGYAHLALGLAAASSGVFSWGRPGDPVEHLARALELSRPGDLLERNVRRAGDHAVGDAELRRLLSRTRGGARR